MTRTTRRSPKTLAGGGIIFALIGMMSELAIGQVEDLVRLPSGEHVSVLPIRDVWSRRNYGEIEYMAYWGTGNELPPLITTSSAADFGVLEQPTTRVVSHGEVSLAGMQGARLTFGRWLDDSLSWAVEAQLLAAGISTGGQFLSSGTTQVLSRPFLNAQTKLQDAQIVSHPLVAQGSIQLEPRTELYSVDILSRCRWREHAHGNLDFVLGYRFLRLRESLHIRETVFTFDQGFDVFDSFDADNEFHGVDLGSVLTLRRGPFEVDMIGKVALGDMRRAVTIDGSTTIADPADTTAGGWLAAPSNMGRRVDHEFAAIPEVGVRLVFLAVEGVEFHFGYNALYLSNVVRSGDQIDTTVDPSQLAELPLAIGGAGTAAERPEARFVDSDMWLHGISFGVELQW